MEMEIEVHDFSSLVGTSIKIKRSDGRIHSALISSITYDNNSVSVQWVEGGDTKAKEITFKEVQDINPGFSFYPKEVEQQKVVEEPRLSTQIERNPTQKVLNGRSSIARLAPVKAHVPSITNNRASIVVNHLDQKRSTSRVKGRSSHVVQEVEKLKLNREGRRQKQAEEREAKEALIRKDPTNPNRELLLMIMQYRSGIDINPLMENDPIQNQAITVCVRKRPLNKLELDRKDVDVITVSSKNQLIVHEPKCKVDLTKYLDNQTFRFDYCFDETCSNEIVYRYTAQPLVKTVFEGGQATCFAYGQTGSGKTHTMGGNFKGKDQDCGIYALVAADVFRLVSHPKYTHLNLVVSASYFEIYSGSVFDLLNKKAKLKILEDGKQQVQIVGLTEKAVHSTDDVLQLIQKGNAARSSGSTYANENSSRSHAIFQIFLRSLPKASSHYGKFSLIDLAGNERGSDTATADRQTRIEGAEINKALLALKECIRALGRQGAYLPFRGSKLTLVLRDFFLGSNSRICMIAMISPSASSCEYTLNTLRYADRVKELKGGSVKNNEETLKPEEDVGMIDEMSTLIGLPENNKDFLELENAKHKMIKSHQQMIKALDVGYRQMVKLFEDTEDNEVDPQEYCARFNDVLTYLPRSMDQSKQCLDEYKSKLAIQM